MMVDDDEDDQDIFFEALREVDSSIHCTMVKTGEEALEMLQRSQSKLPDFIFLDLNMPRMNGKQCVKQIRKEERLANIPVIIYSTSKLVDDIRECKKLDSVHFLTKPNSIGDLSKALQLILEQKWQMIDA